MKKLIVSLLILLALLSLGACGRKKVKILHCDRCGKEVEFPADDNATEDWIIVCAECRKGLD